MKKWSKHSRKVLRETRLGRQTVQQLMECGFHDKPSGVSIEELKQCWDIDFYFIGSAQLHCRRQSSPSAKSDQGTGCCKSNWVRKDKNRGNVLREGNGKSFIPTGFGEKNFGGW